jgi:hypothetical protein
MPHAKKRSFQNFPCAHLCKGASGSAATSVSLQFHNFTILLHSHIAQLRIPTTQIIPHIASEHIGIAFGAW